MPWWPCSVFTSTKSSTVSVSGFWRPVSTLASLTGLSSGSTTWDRRRWRIWSDMAVLLVGDRVCIAVSANLYDE